MAKYKQGSISFAEVCPPQAVPLSSLLDFQSFRRYFYTVLYTEDTNKHNKQNILYANWTVCLRPHS